MNQENKIFNSITYLSTVATITTCRNLDSTQLGDSSQLSTTYNPIRAMAKYHLHYAKPCFYINKVANTSLSNDS